MITRTKILISIAAALAALIGAGTILAPKLLNQNKPVACTDEAMICPNGSAVGRTGPNCEFAQCPAPGFGSSINFTIGKSVTFSDGLTVTLKQINDSRCKPGVVCVWAGELSPVFSVSGGNAGAPEQEITLGTTNNKKVAKGGYAFELQSATETTATIIVTKESLGACYVAGCSGQICSDRQDVASTCEYKSEYACYKTATCARQANGTCGWTSTVELTSCLMGK